MTAIETSLETLRADNRLRANDSVLLPLLEAAGPARVEALERILLSAALPVVDAVVRRKSNRFGKRRRFSAEDEEDIRASAIYRITRRIMADLTEHPIARFTDYCAAVTLHACDDHIRRQRPDHSALRRRILACIRREDRFKCWRAGTQLVCGRSSWPETEPARRPENLAASKDLANGDLAKSLEVIFAQANVPLYLKDVVAIVGEARAPEVFRGELRIPTFLPSASFEHRETLDRVWREVALLPYEQRVALLLNLRDDQGGAALVYLPFLGVASMSEVARALDMSMDRLADIWNDLPLPDAEIARKLGIPQQRVINLRQAGRKRLRRRLAIREI